MEIFKTKFERFQKENLAQVLKCGYCQKTACGSWHKKFLASCKYRRETFCKTCHSFNIAKNSLLENADLNLREYITNFLQDFLCILDETLGRNFEAVERVPVEKLHTIKTYHKSEKNRNQVINKKLVNCKKISYSMKEKFIKKDIL